MAYMGYVRESEYPLNTLNSKFESHPISDKTPMVRASRHEKTPMDLGQGHIPINRP